MTRLEGEIPSPIDPPRGCYLMDRCPMANDVCRADPQRLVALTDAGASVVTGR